MSESTKWFRAIFTALCIGVGMYAYALIRGEHQVSSWESRIQRIEYNQRQQENRNESQDNLNDMFINEFKKLIKD